MADESPRDAISLPAKRLFIVVSALAALNALGAGVAYVLYPGYLDTGEPNIVALAWRLLDGHEIYRAVDDPIRTTNVYGPYNYLVHSVVFWLTGASVTIGKVPGVAALLLTMVLVGWTHDRYGRDASAFAVTLAAGLAALSLPMTIWNRPDVFILLSVAAAVLIQHASGEDDRGRWMRVVGFGVLIGFAMGQKTFAAFYFLPLGLVMLTRDGIKACLATVVIALAVTGWPYALSQFNLVNLIEFQMLLGGKPNSLEGLLKISRHALYYLVPAAVLTALAWQRYAPDERKFLMLYGGGLLLAIALIVYPAQKPGAGAHYWVPLAPLAIDIAVRGYRRWRNEVPRAVWAALAIGLVINALAIPTEKRFYRNLDWDFARGVANEIAEINQDYAGRTIEIGIGDSNESYRRTFQRTRLVFEGHPYSLDTSIVLESTAWGIEIGDGTIAMISGCATDIWLVPAGERPFDWIGYYGNDIYGPAFRAAFSDAYEKAEAREYFDVYTCAR